MDRFAARAARLIFGTEAARWIAPVMARALPGAGLVLAASLAAAALGLAMPMLTRQVIDAGIMARDMPALVFWAGLSFVLGLGAVGFGIVNSMLHLRASAAMLADLRGRLFCAALARDPPCPTCRWVRRWPGWTATAPKFKALPSTRCWSQPAPSFALPAGWR